MPTVYYSENKKPIGAFKWEKRDGTIVWKAASYMYVFLLVPCDPNVHPSFVCGLLSPNGTGDDRVFEVIKRIYEEAFDVSIEILRVLSDGDSMYSAKYGE